MKTKIQKTKIQMPSWMISELAWGNHAADVHHLTKEQGDSLDEMWDTLHSNYGYIVDVAHSGDNQALITYAR